jgi:hypothetical protein
MIRLFLVLFTLLFCFSSVADADEPAGYKSFKNKDLGVKFSYPEDWSFSKNEKTNSYEIKNDTSNCSVAFKENDKFYDSYEKYFTDDEKLIIEGVSPFPAINFIGFYADMGYQITRTQAPLLEKIMDGDKVKFFIKRI